MANHLACVLLWLHLVNGDLGPFQILNDLSFYRNTLNVWAPDMESIVLLDSKHTPERHNVPRRRFQAIAGVPSPFLNKMLHSTHIHDGVLIRGRYV